MELEHNNIQTEFNKYQSTLDEIDFYHLPDEVREQFLEYINGVQFIKNLISPDRPWVWELPRDDKGRAIIDLTNPPLYDDIDFFRPAGKLFEERGILNPYKPNAAKHSDYYKWEGLGTYRSWNGLLNKKTGMWIPGDMYWYLNYCMMEVISQGQDGVDEVNTTVPKFWEGQWWRFLGWYYARLQKKNFAEIAGRRKGKAHSYNQVVYTPDGVKQWGDIKIGDVLFGPDGENTTVVDIPFDEETDIYEVVLADGRSIECSLGHEFLVKDKRKKKENRYAIHSLEYILNNDYAHLRKDGKIENYFSIHTPKSVEFNKKEVLIDPYTLGLLLGDGCFMNNDVNIARITCTVDDFAVFSRYIPYEVYSLNCAPHEHRIKISDFGKCLKYYGLQYKHSHEKFIPKDYLYNTKDVRFNVLKGLLDTDGTVNNNGIPMITTTSKQLYEDIVWLCRSLGYTTRMFVKQGAYKKNGVKISCKTNYNISILTNDPVFNLERQLCKLTKFSSNYSRSRKDWTSIKSINFLRRDKAKCVTVNNESHCYLIGDFVVTHNSNCAASRACRDFYIGESENHQERVTDLFVADSAVYLNKGGVLNLFESMIDFIAHNTNRRHLRLETSLNDMRWVSGFRDLNASRAKAGNLNTVMGLTISDDPDKPRGKAASFIYFEEFGNFNKLSKTYNTTLPSVKQGNKVRGLVVLAGTGGTEGCLTGTCRVMRATGEWVSIKDVTSEDILVGYNTDTQSYSMENIEYIYPKSKKECVKITTNNYRTIECSLDHPIYSSNKYDCNECRVWEWHDAGVLKVGDLMAIAQETPLFGNEYIPEPYIIGVLIGDGCYCSTSTVLHNCDNEIFEYIESRDFKLHDIKTSVPTKDGRILRAVTVKGIYKHLDYLKIRGQSKQRKRLPEAIFKASKKDVCELLAGLFDTDGCVTVKKKSSGNRKPQCTIYFTSCVFEIIEQVRFLLNKLGINCSIEKCVQNKTKGIAIGIHTYYNIKVSDSMSIINFYNNIHLKVKYKQANLKQGYLNAVQTKRWRKNKFEYEKIINIEYIGEQTIYNISVGNTHTYLAEGIITHNSNFQGALDMIYHPQAYGILDFKNLWDINQTESSIFFFPAYVNYEGRIHENGISDVTGALRDILLERYTKKYHASDLSVLTQFMAEYPITIQDSIMQTNSSLFPVTMLRDRLQEIDGNPAFFDDVYVGKLVMHGTGAVEFLPTANKPLRQYKTYDTKDREGAVEIYEMPQKGNDGKVPWGRYCVSTDPVDDDGDNGNLSLQSCFVFDLWTDTIIAEYTGRTQFSADFYEQVRLLCEFYNGTLMYENNKKGIFSYFQRMNSLHRMAETPEYLVSKGLQHRYTIGNKKYGIHNVGGINATGLNYLRDWLISPVPTFVTDAETGKEKEINVCRLQTLKTRALLEELSAWNTVGNFDRVSSMIMMMLYREEKLIVKGSSTWESMYKPSVTENDKFFGEYDKKMKPNNFNDGF